MPRATDLKAALQNSSPDARSQGLALGWSGLLSSGSSGLLTLCWVLWIMLSLCPIEKSMMVREKWKVIEKGSVRKETKGSGGLLKSHKTIFENKSHPVAPS